MSADTTDGGAELVALVLPVARRIPRRDRPRYAILITPEDGVRAVLRAELAARLAGASLIRESREAMRRARDVDSLLVWCETSDAEDATAGFRTLDMRGARS